MNNWTQETRAHEESLLLNYLVERVVGRASGRLDDECLFDLPRDKYFIGNLRPSGETTIGIGFHQNEISTKIAPVAFGGEFLLKPDFEKISVKINLSWACYYRVFPTYQEQQSLIKHEKKEEKNNKIVNDKVEIIENEESDTSIIEQEVEQIAAMVEKQNRRRSKQKDALCPKFRKINCIANGEITIQRIKGETWVKIDNTAFELACEKELERAMHIILDDPDACKTNGEIDTPIKIPIESVISEETFKSAIDQFPISIIPSWQWTVQTRLEKRTGLEGEVLSFIFENTSPMPEKSFSREGYFFNNIASFQFDIDMLQPFEIELAPKGFRYDRHLWAKGFNCSIIQHNKLNYITTNTPIYAQARYDTRNEPEAPFDKLAKNPIPILKNIQNAMQEYLLEWNSMEREYQNIYVKEWQNFQDEYLKDKKCFEDEIKRFEKGLNLIESDDDVLLAFKLTNETFKRTGEHPTKSKTSWRLFQVVFLVTQIPGIYALKLSSEENLIERDIVDIVYFPTGGGKTEAYLGVLVYHCFFDRLRGKTAGVTGWLRFPLRLLTLQQTQRMADAIGIAELVRIEQLDKRLSGQVTGFGVGYFVGQSSSPNKLNSDPHLTSYEDQVFWSKAKDSTEREKWKRIVSCPSCRTKTIRVDLDEDKVRIIHRCTNENCAFQDGKIPIYIVDNEVYRYLPSVIVGTIDKLAGLGNQRKFSMILGSITGKCSKHGYISGKCCQDECKDEKLLDKKWKPLGLSGPTLFIQDELHLLREGLGTFDSHYETFVQELLKDLGQPAPKIIASSATIEAFERQVEHLYGRKREEARIFPGIGPSLKESFYAQTRKFHQRLFVGVIPHNKTLFNTILELIEYYHMEVQKLAILSEGELNPYQGLTLPGTETWKDLVDHYLTTLTYFLATRDLSAIRTDLETHVNSNLESEGFKPLNIAELTGNTSTGEVANILEKVERSFQPEQPNTILATSMVSHGVDVDRFNSMIFYGMPRQNAEYIQASSRVGRSHVGLVLVCHHPIRERDQSHYNYFLKFHEFVGQMVEPVAINRWSKFSIDRTLAGLFMGVLLQIIARGSTEGGKFTRIDFLKKKISTGEITPQKFIHFLKESYRVADIDAPAAKFFSEQIEIRIKQFFDQIIGAGANCDWVSNALYPPPMRSLRDVDEAIEIELDETGSRWASK